MVAIVQRYTNALASGLVPLLSRLSGGTEMASYGNAQWEFLLGSNEVTTFVAVDDTVEDNDTTSDENNLLLGCLLRIDMDTTAAAPKVLSGNGERSTVAAAAAAGAIAVPVEHTTAFGMMLVSPEARGKGLAKLLLNEAMSREDDRRQSIDHPQQQQGQRPRKILAVCTNLGQPLYKRLGYTEVGCGVTGLSATVQCAKNIDFSVGGDTDGAAAEKDVEPVVVEVTTHGSLDRTADDDGEGGGIDPEIRDLISAMDARATGWNRRGRLNKLMGYERGQSHRSVAAIATTSSDSSPIASAVLRQEGPGSPFVIGPMVGSETSVLPLVSALAQAIPDTNENEESWVSLLVPEHPDLVKRLKGVGFKRTFVFPAMSLDERPIYENGDGFPTHLQYVIFRRIDTSETVPSQELISAGKSPTGWNVKAQPRKRHMIHEEGRSKRWLNKE